MKRCPECRRDYTDETLNFCLDDGSPLLDGPSSQTPNEPPTEVFPSYSSEAATQAQVSQTDPTSILGPAGNGADRSRWYYATLVGVLILLVAAGVFAYYKFSGEKSPRVSF